MKLQDIEPSAVILVGLNQGWIFGRKLVARTPIRIERLTIGTSDKH
jgi:hypothetical protein